MMDELDELLNNPTVNVDDEKYKQIHSLFSSPQPQQPVVTQQPHVQQHVQQQPQQQPQQQVQQQPQQTQQNQHQPQQQVQQNQQQPQQPRPIQQQQHVQHQQPQQQQHVQQHQQPQSHMSQQPQQQHQQPQSHIPQQQPQQPQSTPQQPQQNIAKSTPQPQRTTITLTQSQQQYYLSLPNQQQQQAYLHQIRAQQQQQLLQQQRLAQMGQMNNGVNTVNGQVNMNSGGAKPMHMNNTGVPGQPQQPIQKMAPNVLQQPNQQQMKPLPQQQYSQQPQQQMNNGMAGGMKPQQPQSIPQQQQQQQPRTSLGGMNSPTPITSSTTINAKPMATTSTAQQQPQQQYTPAQVHQMQQHKLQQHLMQQQQAQQQQNLMNQQAQQQPTSINGNPSTTVSTPSLASPPTSTTSSSSVQAPSIQQQISQNLAQTSTPPINPSTQPSPAPESKPVDIQAKVQNHFNALALAYRNAKIEKPTLMEHLVMLFGGNNAVNYAKKIDDIPIEKVPPLPKDFDLDNILKRTSELRALTMLFQKTITRPADGSAPTSNANQVNSNNINSINKLPQPQPPPISNAQLTKEQKKEQLKLERLKKKEEKKESKAREKKERDDRRIAEKSVVGTNQDAENEDDKQNIKDLNDVTKIANIDMKNESDHFLPDTNEDDDLYTPETEPLFLNSYPLRKKITAIALKHGLKLSEENFLEFISLATQDHLRMILEFLIKTSKQRVEMHKDELPAIITSDVKKKLMAIEKREKEEKTRKETEEQERVLKEAKEQESLSTKKKTLLNNDDKANSALKEKMAKIKLDKEERERTSAANRTALDAVGNIGRRKPPLSSQFMKSSLFTMGTNPQNIQPPIANSQLVSFQQLIKEGKTLTPEQEIQYQQLKENHENLLRQYHEKIGKDYQPMDIDSNTPGAGGTTNTIGTVGGRAGANKHTNRKITKKDCYFSQKHIGYNVLQKYELLKLRKRFNPQVFPF